ncbi:MAG: HAD-IIB family hydrolase [Burkholderiales bacterium]|nr:HAD-IIB family hydrolase [Burkholderiales bacterium]
MRPLLELPLERLGGLRGLLTDIDDTLVDDGAITPLALAALHRLADARIPVIAITGRPAGWSEPFARAWPVAAIVAENGGVLLRAQDGVLRHEFTVDEAERAARSARLHACAEAVLAQLPPATLARDSAGRLTDIAVDHSEFDHLDEAQIAGVVALMRAHGLTATVSSIHINGWIGEHSKWTAAQWAVQRCLGRAFDAAEWVYLGDSTNDQLMFERMPLSVGVANIRRFVPKLATLPGYVTDAERGAGFAELATRLIAARTMASKRGSSSP